MSKLITNRPEKLDNLEFYNKLPLLPLHIDLDSSIHDFLKFDIWGLDGLQPIEKKYLSKTSRFFGVNPSEELIDTYEKEGINFQLIHIIVNMYGFEEKDGVIIGKPYSISLKPMEKRGEIDEVSPKFFKHFDMEKLRNNDNVYFGFNPFSQSYQIYGNCNFFMSAELHTDMIGFVLNTYALATEWDFEQVCIPPMPDCNKYLTNKYKKYRTRRYFKKFDDIRPRKIWGCDSPIELFLLHALNAKDLTPEIQTALFEDGSTHPSLHQMIASNSQASEIQQITDADFYFPDSKLAIFCDSNAYHRSKKAKAKDFKIDKKLNNLGIRCLRIMGTDIINDPFKCVETIRLNL